MARYALSFDIGGTFTDFALFDLASGRPVAYHKVLTDAREPARGVIEGWQALIADYELVASVQGYPAGSAAHWFRKELNGTDAAVSQPL